MRALATLLMAFFLWSAASAQPLEGVTVVLDPGHGDRAAGDVDADPGASVETPRGRASECVFTWDTAMRLRRRLMALGARVVLTMEDPVGDYDPKPWTPVSFPESSDFRFKTLVDRPLPRSNREALLSRVATANRVYLQASGPTYFLSLHFDSTSPEVGGIKFYYPRQAVSRSGFISQLEDSVRKAGRARVDLASGEEIGVSAPGSYALLKHSINPDSYLIELGNILSRDPDGGNPDLWRMRDPERREEYSAIIAQALVGHQQARGGGQPVASQPAPSKPATMGASASASARPEAREPSLFLALPALAIVAPILLARRRRWPAISASTGGRVASQTR